MVHGWAKTISALSKSANRDEIIAASSKVLDPQQVLLNVKRMRDSLSLLNYNKHKKKIRYVLARCEISLQKHEMERLSTTVKAMMDTSSSLTGWHIDHIFPKSLVDNFPLSESPNQKSKSDVVHSLGNLTLLAPAENLSASNTAPNNPEKQSILTNSQCFLNPLLTNHQNPPKPWPSSITQAPKIYKGLLNIQKENLVDGQKPGDALLDRNWDLDSVKAREQTYFKLFAKDILYDLGFDFSKFDLS